MNKFSNVNSDFAQTDLIKAGKALRQEVSFANLGAFHSVNRDIVQIDANARQVLVPELVPQRIERMWASTFAFFGVRQS